MEENYLICASEDLLLQHGLSLNNCRTEELGELVILYLSKQLLKEMTPVQYCSALKFCTMANNHITDISALRGCVHLIKLDLHGNQIQNLPNQEFWRKLKDLKLLYLHNNRIRNLSNAESLSACPGLIGLTLFDTPLSLQKNYRHIVVNSIWSLKALDDCVISDEEIIEDWSLQGRFKALCPELQINMSPTTRKDISVQSELQDINEIITKINRILAACSPVLIVQKWIRGYLLRRRMGLISQPEAQRTKLHSKHRRSQEKEEERKSPFVGAILKDKSSALPKISRKLAAVKQPMRRVNGTPDAAPLKHITVDLWKIQKDVMQVLPETEIAYDLKKPSQQQPATTVTDLPLNKEEIVDTNLKEHKQDQIPKEPEHEKELSLFGKKNKVHESSPSKDLLESIKGSAKDIRTSIQQIHSTVEAKQQPPHLTIRRRSAQHSGSINLLPLSAIDKAYENRERINEKIQKSNLVKQIQADKKQAKYHKEQFLEARRKHVAVQNQKDFDNLQQGVRQNLLRQYNLIDNIKYRSRKFVQEKEAKKWENAFVKEFNTQHTSVTKTLMRHDRLIRSQEEMQQKIKVVQSLKENQEKQRKFIKCLQEHRQLVLQFENTSEKTALDSLIHQHVNSRLQDAQAHVSSMKVQYSTVEPMDKIPVKQPFPKKELLAYN
ncbi:leucine-rich repeat and IQ domain-containing protein 3 [Gastrophryne carolinensis]